MPECKRKEVSFEDKAVAIQPTPPIQLDPSMDRGHELAFINQNFQSIANVLQQNSFVIVGQGNITIPPVTTTKAGTNQYGFFVGTTTTVPHNLGYIPIILAFISTDGGTTFVPLPWTFQNGVSATSFTTVTYRIVVNNVNVSGVSEALTYNASITDNGAIAKYFLLQQTAN